MQFCRGPSHLCRDQRHAAARSWPAAARRRPACGDAARAAAHSPGRRRGAGPTRAVSPGGPDTSSGRAATAAAAPAPAKGAGEAGATKAVAASLALGALLGGAGVGLDDALPESVQRLSASMGWMMFFCWSISCWPQARLFLGCLQHLRGGEARRRLQAIAACGAALGMAGHLAPAAPAAAGWRAGTPRWGARSLRLTCARPAVLPSRSSTTSARATYAA